MKAARKIPNQAVTITATRCGRDSKNRWGTTVNQRMTGIENNIAVSRSNADPSRNAKPRLRSIPRISFAFDVNAIRVTSENKRKTTTKITAPPKRLPRRLRHFAGPKNRDDAAD